MQRLTRSAASAAGPSPIQSFLTVRVSFSVSPVRLDRLAVVAVSGMLAIVTRNQMINDVDG